MTKTYDIALIGGGASSLSLLYAMHLQGILDQYHIALIEPEAKDSNDRTWCFWTDQMDPAWQMFSSCVSHRWVQVEGATTEPEAMSPYQYVQIRSKDFYAFVEEALAPYPNIKRIKDSVHKLRYDQFYRIGLSSGAEVLAQDVFDSRPPKIVDRDLIWQSFVGYRIKAKGANFNIDYCRLMDFEVPQVRGLQFMYFLPTHQEEALIEFTRFGKFILNEEESKPIIEAYLKNMGIEEYQIEEKEINKIPMTLSLNSKQKWHERGESYFPIGVRAGVVKASTGFAFKKIAAHSWEIALALKQGAPIPKPGHSKAAWLYDELLLNLWQKRNNPLPKIFKRLFKVHPLPRIFRFLDEQSAWWEDFLIMFHMPWGPFFWSIGRSIWKRVFR